jgi:hypothetical protein
MTKLYKTTGIEIEIIPSPPPKPLPPPPDPNVPTAPKTVETRSEEDPNAPEAGHILSSSVQFVDCTTTDGDPGIRVYVGGNPISDCGKIYQGVW